MSLRLILGRAGTGKTARVFGEIATAVSERRGGIVLLTPEQYTHEAERELSRTCGDSASLYAEVLSFTRLYNRVANLVGGMPAVSLDKGGKLLIMALAAESVRTRLKAFGAACGNSETQLELLGTLDELKASCVTAEALYEMSLKCGGSLGNKLADMSLLFETYEALTERSGADPSDRLTRLAEAIPRMAGTWEFYIDGFVDFTEQETRVILALLRRGCRVTLCLTCDSLAGGSEIFETSRNTALRLIREVGEMGLPNSVEFLESDDSSNIGLLERHLFSYTNERPDVGGDISGIQLYRTGDMTEECELAAAEALRLVRETGCRWRDIAITARGFEDYATALSDIFDYYGVPLYLSRKGTIFEKSVPAMFASIMEILSGGWEHDAVFGYLKTGLSGIDNDDLDALENYVYLWNIRGEAMWSRNEPWAMHPGGYGARETEESDALIRRIDETRRFVSAPLRQLSIRGRESETARQQAEIFGDFLKDIRLAERLETRADEFSAIEGREQLAAEYAQIWELCVDALEQCAVALGDMPMTQRRFFETYHLVLSRYDVGTIPVALDRVSAGDMDRMRRRNIRHLFVLGASDDRLPQILESRGVFSDNDRDRLRELGLNLGDSGDIGLYREMNLIYNCLTLPSDTLTVSYSENGENSRPSFVIKRLEQLFGQDTKAVDFSSVRTASKKPAFEFAALSTRPYNQVSVAAVYSNDSSIAVAAEYFNRERPGALEKLEKAALATRGTLSRESVLTLYGNSRRLSATRAETLSSCRFKYFMQYGLRLKPRVRAGFDPPEMGTFMHYVLEGVTREVAATGGFNDDAVKKAPQLAQKYVERYIDEELQGFRDKSSRFVYLFRRLSDSVKQVVSDMLEELSRSDFEPLDFELDFSSLHITPDLESASSPSSANDLEDVSLGGIADRVDGWLHDGKLYLRVIDYKTGNRQFSLSDVWYGMGLQMLMYLYALSTGAGERLYRNEIVPAGVLYTPARDLLISADQNISDEEIIRERAKRLQRSGLILDDSEVIEAMEHGETPRFLPVKFNKEGLAAGDALASAEQMGQLMRHVSETLKKLAAEQRRGSIDADPYYRSNQDSACLWCDYFGACHFEESKDRRRFLSKLKPSEVWDNLQQAVEHETGEGLGSAKEPAKKTAKGSDENV